MQGVFKAEKGQLSKDNGPSGKVNITPFLSVNLVALLRVTIPRHPSTQLKSHSIFRHAGVNTTPVPFPSSPAWYHHPIAHTESHSIIRHTYTAGDKICRPGDMRNVGLGTSCPAFDTASRPASSSPFQKIRQRELRTLELDHPGHESIEHSQHFTQTHKETARRH